MTDTITMNDINLEIVHEINVRYWQQQYARLTPAYLSGVISRYLLIPAVVAWILS